MNTIEQIMTISNEVSDRVLDIPPFKPGQTSRLIPFPTPEQRAQIVREIAEQIVLKGLKVTHRTGDALESENYHEAAAAVDAACAHYDELFQASQEVSA